MTEIFTNVRDEVKHVAEAAWILVKSKDDPSKAAELLHTVVEYARNVYTEEEVEFLQFYFNMQMEMMKNG